MAPRSGTKRPDSLVGHEFFIAFTGTSPEFRAWEGLTALVSFTDDHYTVRFLTTHPEVPPAHRGRWTPGTTGETTLTWDAEETSGLPGRWAFTFGFVGATVGTFTSAPAQGGGQAPGIFLMKQ